MIQLQQPPSPLPSWSVLAQDSTPSLPHPGLEIDQLDDESTTDMQDEFPTQVQSRSSPRKRTAAPRASAPTSLQTRPRKRAKASDAVTLREKEPASTLTQHASAPVRTPISRPSQPRASCVTQNATSGPSTRSRSRITQPSPSSPSTSTHPRPRRHPRPQPSPHFSTQPSSTPTSSTSHHPYTRLTELARARVAQHIRSTSNSRGKRKGRLRSSSPTSDDDLPDHPMGESPSQARRARKSKVSLTKPPLDMIELFSDDEPPPRPRPKTKTKPPPGAEIISLDSDSDISPPAAVSVKKKSNEASSQARGTMPQVPIKTHVDTKGVVTIEDSDDEVARPPQPQNQSQSQASRVSDGGSLPYINRDGNLEQPSADVELSLPPFMADEGSTPPPATDDPSSPKYPDNDAHTLRSDPATLTEAGLQRQVEFHPTSLQPHAYEDVEMASETQTQTQGSPSPSPEPHLSSEPSQFLYPSDPNEPDTSYDHEMAVEPQLAFDPETTMSLDSKLQSALKVTEALGPGAKAVLGAGLEINGAILSNLGDPSERQEEGKGCGRGRGPRQEPDGNMQSRIAGSPLLLANTSKFAGTVPNLSPLATTLDLKASAGDPPKEGIVNDHEMESQMKCDLGIAVELSAILDPEAKVEQAFGGNISFVEPSHSPSRNLRELADHSEQARDKEEADAAEERGITADLVVSPLSSTDPPSMVFEVTEADPDLVLPLLVNSTDTNTNADDPLPERTSPSHNMALIHPESSTPTEHMMPTITFTPIITPFTPPPLTSQFFSRISKLAGLVLQGSLPGKEDGEAWNQSAVSLDDFALSSAEMPSRLTIEEMKLHDQNFAEALLSSQILKEHLFYVPTPAPCSPCTEDVDDEDNLLETLTLSYPSDVETSEASTRMQGQVR